MSPPCRCMHSLTCKKSRNGRKSSSASALSTTHPRARASSISARQAGSPCRATQADAQLRMQGAGRAWCWKQGSIMHVTYIVLSCVSDAICACTSSPSLTCSAANWPSTHSPRLARVMATFMRRTSATKPTPRLPTAAVARVLALSVRTRDTIVTSSCLPCR